MRKYYIYKQDVKQVGWDKNNLSIYHLGGWVCLGYLLGSQEVYNYLGGKTDIAENFDYEYTNIKIHTWRFLVPSRILITNDKHKIMSSKELYKNINNCKTREGRGRCSYRFRSNSIHGEQKKSITPEEIINVQNEYGIRLKPIKNKRLIINSWKDEKQARLQRSWKKYRKTRYK